MTIMYNSGGKMTMVAMRIKIVATTTINDDNYDISICGERKQGL